MSLGELKELIAFLQDPSSPGGPISDNANVMLTDGDEAQIVRSAQHVKVLFGTTHNRSLLIT